jgi:predicted dehydrogenase
MKLAIVGSGMIVNDFLPSAGEISNLTLAAIVGLPAEREKLEELSQQHRIDEVYVDFEECLADPAVDTVWVAVPNSLHMTFARRALLSGKHVICEKPFVLTVDDLVELRKLADERDLILVEGITTLYLSNYRWIVENLSSLGDVRLVQSEYSQYSSRYPAFLDGQVLPAFDPTMGAVP